MKLPLLAMGRLIKKAGAKRASNDAKETLSDELNKKIKAISNRAREFSEHAKRKTIKKQDIILSLKENQPK